GLGSTADSGIDRRRARLLALRRGRFSSAIRTRIPRAQAQSSELHGMLVHSPCPGAQSSRALPLGSRADGVQLRRPATPAVPETTSLRLHELVATFHGRAG